MYTPVLLFRRHLTVRVTGKKPRRFYSINFPDNPYDAYAFEVENAHPRGCPWRQFCIRNLAEELDVRTGYLLSRAEHRRVLAHAIASDFDFARYALRRETQWWRRTFDSQDAPNDPEIPF